MTIEKRQYTIDIEGNALHKVAYDDEFRINLVNWAIREARDAGKKHIKLKIDHDPKLPRKNKNAESAVRIDKINEHDN